MSVPHPWRALRGLPHLRVHWRDDMPEWLRGATDGVHVWLRDDMSQVERRCVLAHELEHIRRGHGSCQPDAVERAVRAGAARYLLPEPRVVADALVWARMDTDAAADVLWVTPRVLMDRLDRRHLHPAEHTLIVARVAAADLTP